MTIFYYASYGLVILGALISIIASWNVKRTYSKYSSYGNSLRIRAEQVAHTILSSAGIYDVRIERISGNLTDHYSPREKVLRLSDSVYGSTSVAAIGVAAHECGHAIQHARGYLPLTLRSMVIPVINIGSTLSWPVILLGLIFGWTGLIDIGIILFSLVVFFQFITLPVEFNASGRALSILRERNILFGQELEGSRKVLIAAALTYVVALVSSILQLLRLVLLRKRR